MSKCDHLIIDHKSTAYLGRKNSTDFKKTSKYGQLVIKKFSKPTSTTKRRIILVEKTV